MTKRRGVYLTKTERVSRVALIVEVFVPAVGTIGYDPGEDVWMPIKLHPASRRHKRQQLRCACGGWTPYPAAVTWRTTCGHIESLIRGEIYVQGDQILLRGFVGRLAPIGEKLFAWKIAERILAESTL